MKVLIVEDELYVRKGIVETVDWESLGCMVCGEASNGVEGLSQAIEMNPDIIITDIRMPQMDGLEMLKKLKEKGFEGFTVFLTAYSDFDYALQALRLGAADYILKPFHDGDLEHVVKKITAKLNPSEKTEDLYFPALKAQASQKNRYVAEAGAYIQENYQNPDLKLGQIAENLRISEGHLSHIFRRETGFTLIEYLTQYRIFQSTKLLAEHKLKIYEIAEAVGFRDIAYFSGTFRKLTGKPPSEF